jgi:glutamate racemase
MKSPIGIFDSGYGGLTVLKELIRQLPEYDYLYLGDNARAPYGNRSFETVYRYTLQCVKWFFEQGCPLVILACNTASAKALRTIQQRDLPQLDPHRRVLGVIRPTAEVIGHYSRSGEVGIFATSGTVQSCSYVLETAKFFPEVKLFQQACPLWVPLIENNEHHSPGAQYFLEKYTAALLSQSANIDTILLACTHYPLIEEQIRQVIPPSVKLLSQGQIIAQSLSEYLLRHPEMDRRLSKEGHRAFHTTDDVEDFNRHAGLFYGSEVSAIYAALDS